MLAMQQIRPGGTLIMLLHRIEKWHTVQLLYLFSKLVISDNQNQKKQ